MSYSVGRLTVGVFGLSGPALIAQSRGLFSARGLDVDFEQVTSSDQQFQNLAAGRYQLVVTAFDNIVSYTSNEHNAVGRRLDLVTAAAYDAGMNLSLIGTDATSIAELRGGVLAVDAEDTGFAFVLFELLERAGLSRADYTLVRHGGVFQRYRRILAGDSSATLLSNGFEALATLAGLNILGTSDDVVRPYLGGVLGVERRWFSENSAAVTAFNAAYEEALTIALDPANLDEVVAAISAARGASVEQSQAIWAGETGSRGLLRATTIGLEGAKNVIALRAAHRGFERGAPPDPEALVGALAATQVG